MGRRNDWNAVRMVAEDIAAGEQRSWQLARNVQHPSSGWEAIKELEGKDLITVAGYQVEPTPAFWPWLEELQSIETAQAIARQKTVLSPWHVPALVPEPAKPVAAAPTVPDDPGFQTSLIQAPATSRFRRPQVIRPDLTHFDTFCVTVLACLRQRGGRVTSSQLRRGVSGYRYPEIYNLALQRLQSLRALKVEKEPGTRRQWVTLLKIPRKYEATRPEQQRQRHKPRSRGQTPWFKRLMAEQELED